MTVDSCFRLGKIIKPHGMKGELSITLAVDKPENFLKKESVFIEVNKKLVPFFIQKMTLLQNSRALLQLEDVTSEMEVAPLLDCIIYLPLTALPKLSKGHFYYHEVINYSVVDKTLGTLGVVAQIYEMPGQDMLEMSYQDCEVLIPMNEAIVQNADHTKKEIYVTLPTGLLEVYIEPKSDIPDDAD